MKRIAICLSSHRMTRTKWVAAAWIAGVTVPAALATVFIVGCCVLPFHGLLHKVMPLCHIATHVLHGDADDDHHDHDTQTAPVPPKQEPVKQAIKFLRPLPQTIFSASVVAETPATTPAAYRSFVTLGAARCDDDVGRRLASLTFLRV